MTSYLYLLPDRYVFPTILICSVILDRAKFSNHAEPNRTHPLKQVVFSPLAPPWSLRQGAGSWGPGLSYCEGRQS